MIKLTIQYSNTAERDKVHAMSNDIRKAYGIKSDTQYDMRIEEL